MKMPQPLFTIITATYNRRDLLPRTIQSILNQTFKDFELFVIDNGSTDDTRYIVEQFRDSRIKYTLNPHPTKSCDAPRNLGIEMANGSLVSFLDDDDIWYPERLEKVKNAFDRNPDVSVVCHYENKRVNGRVEEVLKHGPWTEDIFEILLYERNCLSPCATTIKTELLRGLNGFDLRKEFDAAADYDLWLRMTAQGAKIYFIQEPLGEFTLDGNNWSIVDPAFISRASHIFEKHITAFEKKPIFRISKKGMRRLLRLYYIAAQSFLKAGEYKNALKYYQKAFLFIILRPTLLVEFTRNSDS